VSDLSLSLSPPRSLSLYFFFSPVQLKRRSDRAALVGTWCPARLNYNKPKGKENVKKFGETKYTNKAVR